jgi:hypothetical protein
MDERILKWLYDVWFSLEEIEDFFATKKKFASFSIC